MSYMDEIVIIDSSTDLDQLRAMLEKAWRLRVSVSDGQVTFKSGGSTWSIPMGSLDPECSAAQRIRKQKELVDTSEFCGECEHAIPGHYNGCVMRDSNAGHVFRPYDPTGFEVTEKDEPELCGCGTHYVGADCKLSYAQLAQRFPYIVKWDERMGSMQYFREANLQKAIRDNAPADAIYYQANEIQHPVGVFTPPGWRTVNDIENPDIISEWGLSEDNRSKHESGQAIS